MEKLADSAVLSPPELQIGVGSGFRCTQLQRENQAVSYSVWSYAVDAAVDE